MDAREARRLAHLGLLEFVADHVEVGSGQVTKDELWARYLASTPPELRTTRAALLRYIWSHYREHLRGGQFHYQPILKGIRLLYSIHPPRQDFESMTFSIHPPRPGSVRVFDGRAVHSVYFAIHPPLPSSVRPFDGWAVHSMQFAIHCPKPTSVLPCFHLCCPAECQCIQNNPVASQS